MTNTKNRAPFAQIMYFAILARTTKGEARKFADVSLFCFVSSVCFKHTANVLALYKVVFSIAVWAPKIGSAAFVTRLLHNFQFLASFS